MKGKIDISKLKTPPEKHELDTARFFAERGIDIIFDLRKVQVNEKQCLSELNRRFQSKTYVKKLLIIKKNGELIEHAR